MTVFRAAILLMVLLCGSAVGQATGALANSAPVRFGLTSVVVRENIPFFQKWARYLEDRIGRPVEFVQRRSYREVMELLETGELDFAWICGYPFVRPRTPEFLELLAVPLFEGAPFYRSYIITQADGTQQSLGDLKDTAFAFSDPDSNSGYLVPRALLNERGETPDTFFRLTFFTYNHAETVEAVAAGVADGGAVDSYVWEFLARERPDLTARTRIIHRSEPYGFPPVVARIDTGSIMKAAMRDALLDMQRSATGKELLDELALDEFQTFRPPLYDDIRTLAAQVATEREMPWP